ncbi:MAG: DMT family transporter [Anaerolineae bacterium]
MKSEKGGMEEWQRSNVRTLKRFNIRTFHPPKSLIGASLALASAACIAVTFIASKEAMRELSPLAFTPIWFLVASAWGLGFYLFQYGWYVPGEVKSSLRPILWLGFLNGLANWLFFSSINLGDPTLVAFFSRSETIYSVLLGAWLLGERMRRYQWLGIAIALIGTGLMTFQGGRVVFTVMLLTLASNFFLALSTLVAKKYVHTVPPLILSTGRTLVMTFMLGLMGLVAQQLTWPGLISWLWIIGGAFFGPFLSYLLFYQSLRYLDLAKGAVIRATQPLFVAVYSLLLFGVLIDWPQFLGGVAMMAGVLVMLWEREK